MNPSNPDPVPTPGFWNDLVNLHREFRVCRFNFAVAAVGLYVFVKVDQAAEILRSLGEESTFQVLKSGPTPGLRWTGIVLGALAWSLAGWYTCRLLLEFDFFAPGEGRPLGAFWGRWQRWLREGLPRVFGVVPLLIMALGFWHASTTYDPDTPGQAPGWLRGYAAGCVALAALLYWLLVYRCRFLGYQAAGNPRFPSRHGTKLRLGDLEGSTRAALWAMTALSVLLLVVFSVNPILVAGPVGSGAVLLFAAAGWTFWGSVAVYVFERFRVPLLTILVGLAAVFSLLNDNHFVRMAAPDGYRRPTVEEAFAAWHANAARFTQEPVHPLFIVATEGGGIRAAYWTAAVLGKLEDGTAQGPSDFAEHLFAISGVSGGSLGAAAFDAALAGPHTGAVRPGLSKMLGEDFLAPPLAALLYPDLLQRFLPYPFAGLDRGQWLERAWEQAARKHLNNDYFARNFNDLWAGRNPPSGYLPALFLNGTSVESGQRIIASNVVVDHRFLDGIDASNKLPGKRQDCDLPLSTAAHNSARFTYVSPAGRFRNGTHVVDGGYFENSGATTALELLRAVKKIIQDGGLTDVHPYVIYISNNPTSGAKGGRDLKRKDRAVSNEQKQHRPGSFLEDALAPVWAMVNTRDAHDSHAQLALREEQGYADEAEFFFFGLTAQAIPLPLGWKLSGTAVKEMNRQADGPVENNPDELIDGKNNPRVFKEVLGLLGVKDP